MEITKLSVREKLVVDVSVWMNNPEDYDFSPQGISGRDHHEPIQWQ